MPEFFFQRYVNGQRMADDVLITKQATLEDAIPAALRLCWNSPKSVLVHIPQTPWRDIESAPKDGTPVVGCSTYKNKSGNLCYNWIADGYFDECGYWYFASFNFAECEYSEVTHWMPIPETAR